MLIKFEKIIHRLSGWCEWIGIAGLLAMMVITCIDVVGAKLFKSPLLGALDMVMLSQIVAMSFASSITLIAGRHIQVESFFNILPRFLQILFNVIVILLGVMLFILIIWQLGMLGYSFQTSGEYSPTAYIPLYPFAYAAAFAFIPVFLILVIELFKSLTGRLQK